CLLGYELPVCRLSHLDQRRPHLQVRIESPPSRLEHVSGVVQRQLYVLLRAGGESIRVAANWLLSASHTEHGSGGATVSGLGNWRVRAGQLARHKMADCEP